MRHHPTGLAVGLAALCLIVSIGSAGQSYLNPPFNLDYDITEWLRSHVAPFADGVLGEGAKDLAFLEEVAETARVVALGEATHGTHEFFVVKHRIIEYLVTHMGFSVVALEASDTELRGVQDYLRTGCGDVEALLATLGALATQELVDLVRWMRALHVAGVPDPPMVRGIDIERSAACRTMTDVEAYLATVDKAAADTARAAYQDFRPYASRADIYAPAHADAPPMDEGEGIVNALEAVHQGLLSRRDDYAAASGDRLYRRAVYDARRVVQLAEIEFGQPGQAIRLRDQYMAENVLHLLQGLADDEGVVVSAHNGHVATSLYGARAVMLGDHLRDALGEALLVVGTSFFDGVFLAFPLDEEGLSAREWQAALPSEESIEYAFRSTGIPRFALDLRGTDRAAAGAGWLWDRKPFYGLYGTAYQGSMQPVWIVLPEVFDVILHIQTTTPSAWLGPFP